MDFNILLKVLHKILYKKTLDNIVGKVCLCTLKLITIKYSPLYRLYYNKIYIQRVFEPFYNLLL